RALAEAGGHDRQRVMPTEHQLQHLLLPRLELVKAEFLFRNFANARQGGWFGFGHSPRQAHAVPGREDTETRRQGDKETRRQGEGEKGRGGNEAKRRPGGGGRFAWSQWVQATGKNRYVKSDSAPSSKSPLSCSRSFSSSSPSAIRIIG